MFGFRPDARVVWENSDVKQRLYRYWKITQGLQIPRYLIAKKLSVDPLVDIKQLPEDELWDHHDAYSDDFNRLLENVDGELISFDAQKTPKTSFLDLSVALAFRILTHCTYCERKCKIDRTKGQLGICNVGTDSVVSSAFLHMGEESVLVPSGTIFFSGCTFKCVFCQNHSISQEWKSSDGNRILDGVVRSPSQIASLARDLARQGARNINWVGGDPTSNIHTILETLQKLDQKIAQLWNSNMYLSKKSMKLLLPLMDFWLPDFKYWEDDFAYRMSGIKNYREVVSRNIKMAHDIGSGEIVIRHLVMPGRVEEDSIPILSWCSREVPNALVNIMAQYRPEFRVRLESEKFKDINRHPTREEVKAAKDYASELGILWEPVS